MNKEGILIVVSGFSGAGKGTIMKALLERYDNMHYPSLQQQETQDREKKKERLIFSKQLKNLKK